jgi:hypothetical protein
MEGMELARRLERAIGASRENRGRSEGTHEGTMEETMEAVAPRTETRAKPQGAETPAEDQRRQAEQGANAMEAGPQVSREIAALTLEIERSLAASKRLQKEMDNPWTDEKEQSIFVQQFDVENKNCWAARGAKRIQEIRLQKMEEAMAAARVAGARQ